jgi:hypothetical protein
MNPFVIDGWTCADVGTARFQGYAPDRIQILLERECDLPHTGLQFTWLWVAAVLLIIAFGLILRRFAR